MANHGATDGIAAAAAAEAAAAAPSSVVIVITRSSIVTANKEFTMSIQCQQFLNIIIMSILILHSLPISLDPAQALLESIDNRLSLQ